MDQNLDGLDIVLAPEATITGVVRDPEGIPVASASISIEIEAHTEPKVSTWTAKDGSYRLRGIPVGEHEVAASTFAYATARHTLKVTAGENRFNLTLGPKRPKIRVRVVGPDGEPVKGLGLTAVFPDLTPCGVRLPGPGEGPFELLVLYPEKKGLLCRIIVQGSNYSQPSRTTFIVGQEPTDFVEVRLRGCEKFLVRGSSSGCRLVASFPYGRYPVPLIRVGDAGTEAEVEGSAPFAAA